MLSMPIARQDPPGPPPADAAGTLTVLDLRLPGDAGLVLLDKLILIDKLLELDPGARIVMLTAQARLARAAEAVRQRAAPYRATAGDADALLAAIARDTPAPPGAQPSLERLAWEHMQRVLAQHQGNKAATARALKIDRNTLRRRLQRPPPAE
jgi:two-component system response regulator RegA